MKVITITSILLFSFIEICEVENICKSVPLIRRVSLLVKASHYHAHVEQTDSTPLVTASNREIDTNKLKSGGLKWVAVSRDFLKSFNKNGLFKYGDHIEISGIGELSGKYTIVDCMAKCYKQKIDILVHHEKKFKQFEKAVIHYQSKFNF